MKHWANIHRACAPVDISKQHINHKAVTFPKVSDGRTCFYYLLQRAGLKAHHCYLNHEFNVWWCHSCATNASLIATDCSSMWTLPIHCYCTDLSIHSVRKVINVYSYFCLIHFLMWEVKVAAKRGFANFFNINEKGKIIHLQFSRWTHLFIFPMISCI